MSLQHRYNIRMSSGIVIRTVLRCYKNTHYLIVFLMLFFPWFFVTSLFSRQKLSVFVSVVPLYFVKIDNINFGLNVLINGGLKIFYWSIFYSFFTLQKIKHSSKLAASSKAKNNYLHWPLREKCPNTEFFSSAYFPVFSPNTGKYRPEKTPFLDTLHAVEN